MTKFIYINAVLGLLFLLSPVKASALIKDEMFPFMVVCPDTTANGFSISDEEFYRRSMTVLFKVNRSEIGPDNDFVKTYNESIVPLVNKYHLQLSSVIIRGAASPEGPYENNRRLGIARSQSLLDFFQEHLIHQEGKASVEPSSVTEDYGYLCRLMKEAGDRDYSKVQKIFDDCGGNEPACKAMLQKADGGKLWRRLLKEYFPSLRAARFMLVFSLPKDPVLKARYENVSAVDSEIPFRLEAPFAAITAPITIKQPTFERRHLIALRTNLVNDLWYQPKFGFAPMWNIQAEYYPLTGHWTANFSFTSPYYHKWNEYKFFQIRDYRLSARRYFKGNGEFLGWFANAYLEAAKYGIGFSKTEGWEGEGAGAGLGFGYVMPLNRKGDLRLEFIAELGAFGTVYDPYVYGNPLSGTEDGKYYYDYLGNASDFKERNHWFTWFGPTMVGVQLTYDIIYRHKKVAGYEK
jgi:Protein of unknown function (DUF3575).